MRCEQVLEKLELFVLGELPRGQADELEAHLASCLNCRERVEEYRLLVCQIRLLAERAGPSPSTERVVREAVLAEINAERSRERTRVLLLAVGSAAAVLLLSAVAFVWHLGGFHAGALGPTAARPSPPQTNRHQQAAGPAQLPIERWRYLGAWAVADTLADEFIVRGQNLFLLQSDPAGSYVVAVDAGTGSLRWRSAPQIAGYLAADERRVFCLATSRTATVQLVALDATDGKVLWRHAGQAGGRPNYLCAPVPLTRERVCWTERNIIHMLDARNGKPIWIQSIPDEPCLSCPEIENDRVYVASCKWLYCLSALSGEQMWSEMLDGSTRLLGQPLLALAGQMLYVARGRPAGGSELICIDLTSRRVLWQKNVGRARSLLATNERVYLRSDGIVALDGRTGEPLWQCNAAGCGPLTLADGLIHFVDSSDQGRLVAVDQDTGKKVWEMHGLRSCDAFIKLGSTGYIKTRDGTVHALALIGRLRS